MKIGLHTFTPYERLFFSRIYPNNHYKLTPPPVMTVVTLYQHQHDKHHLHHSGIIASEKLYENWPSHFYPRRATLFFSRIYPNNHHKHDSQHPQHHYNGIIASEKWGGSEEDGELVDWHWALLHTRLKESSSSSSSPPSIIQRLSNFRDLHHHRFNIIISLIYKTMMCSDPLSIGESSWSQ